MRTVPLLAAIFFAVLCMSTASIMIRLCVAPAMVIALYRVAFTTGLAGLIEGRNLRKNDAIETDLSIFWEQASF